MAGRFKAVGFDMDGTFLRTKVDYDRLNNIDREVLERHGIPFDEIDFGGMRKRLRTPIRNWLEANGRLDEWPAVYREIDEETLSCECEFVSEAVPFPGSVESIAAIRGMGLKVGILTRGGLEYARRALGPLFGEFDCVMGRDHSFYDDAKPSPVAMRQFAEGLGVSPEDLLYVGDNLTDWQSAHGAGSTFVGVLTGSCTRDDWLRADPDMIVIERAGDVVDLLESRRGGIRRSCRPDIAMLRHLSDISGSLGPGSGALL